MGNKWRKRGSLWLISWSSSSETVSKPTTKTACVTSTIHWRSCGSMRWDSSRTIVALHPHLHLTLRRQRWRWWWGKGLVLGLDRLTTIRSSLGCWTLVVGSRAASLLWRRYLLYIIKGQGVQTIRQLEGEAVEEEETRMGMIMGGAARKIDRRALLISRGICLFLIRMQNLLEYKEPRTRSHPPERSWQLRSTTTSHNYSSSHFNNSSSSSSSMMIR